MPPYFPTVMLTGANRGLGLEFVRQLLAAGSRVIAICQPQAPLDALRQLRVVHGENLEITELELSSMPAISAFRSRLAEARGLDLLIHNAATLGGPHASGIDSVGAEGFDEAFRVNVAAPLFLTQAMLPLLLKSSRTAIVAVLCSRTGLVSGVLEEPGRNLFYSLSKAAAHRLVTALASELAPRGVAVVGLNPGWVLTDMTAGGLEKPSLLPGESAGGLLGVLSKIQITDTGRFFHYNGSRALWEAVNASRV